ncbi:MAG: aa3-type cytochrome oxidase subunit IV [Acidimicrobiales bacterium]
MKVEWRLFAGAAAFLALTGSVYWFVSYEDAGTTLLLMGLLAVGMVAGWLFLQSRRLGGPRPEDRADALPGDGAGELGCFPVASVWPFVLGWGAVVAANALVFGVWLGVTGLLIITVGIIGYAVEASRK